MARLSILLATAALALLSVPAASATLCALKFVVPVGTSAVLKDGISTVYVDGGGLPGVGLKTLEVSRSHYTSTASVSGFVTVVFNGGAAPWECGAAAAEPAMARARAPSSPPSFNLLSPSKAAAHRGIPPRQCVQLHGQVQNQQGRLDCRPRRRLLCKHLRP